ncbi:MAG: DMT family transporter [Polyangiaceae bacterium]
MNRSAIAAGASLALLAAVAFGVTTPLLDRAGKGLGSFTIAALLYAGAALSAAALRLTVRASGAPLRRAHLIRLAMVAVFGAALAPTLLAWGLRRTGPTTASLLLNLEAVFTVLLARAIYREPLGRRVLGGLTLIALGGVALTLDAARAASWDALGALAVGGATLAWAVDNTLTRALANHDPVVVVAGKGALGALLTAGAAMWMREPFPDLRPAAELLLLGATGYGLSLRLYLLAQRHIGAARTGSIFAIGPFVGAVLGFALGDRTVGWGALAAAGLIAVGVGLHVTERHSHRHRHSALTHDHAHRHDDGHHDHDHDPPIEGEHAHAHSHGEHEHEHEHGPDLHHDHAHA